LEFHRHPFSADRQYAGETKTYEQHYSRDKKWLQARLAIREEPFADFPELDWCVQMASGKPPTLPDPEPLSLDQLIQIGQRLNPMIYEPDI
jgi:hypothetical protein